MSAADIVRAIPLPAALIGADQRFVVVNNAFGRLFGDDLLGRPYVNALRHPSMVAAVEQVLNGGAAANEVYWGGGSGRETTYDVAIKPVAADVLITLIDRTASEAAGKMRRDFVANVSHELRTPLTALMGYIETLRGAARDDPAARDRFLGSMAQEATRMTGLVDELLTLSRLEEIERQRPTDRVILGDVVKSVRDSLMIIAQNAGVTLEFELPDTPITVTGDAAQLQQVFTNLIENGIKYGGEAGRVCVSIDHASHFSRLRGDGVMITVRDHGDGIAAHHIARLTERFYRVDNHRSRAVGGTGLGLAIVKHIISRHRGRLRIVSDIGAGTVVSVLLPALKSDVS